MRSVREGSKDGIMTRRVQWVEDDEIKKPMQTLIYSSLNAFGSSV